MSVLYDCSLFKNTYSWGVVALLRPYEWFNSDREIGKTIKVFMYLGLSSEVGLPRTSSLVYPTHLCIFCSLKRREGLQTLLP